MNTQLQLTQRGGPFEVVQVPKPSLKPGEILVRQQFTALNPLDCKQRDYGLFIPSYPHVLGIEGSGTVEAIGAGVEDLQAGDEVALWGNASTNGGSYQTHVAIPSAFAIKKPKNITLEEATSLPICYVTAICTLLVPKIPLPFLPSPSPTEGHTPASVLVLGGASGIGAALIQLLRLAYTALPIVATASPKHHGHLTSLGATALVDYNSSSLVSDIKAASPDKAGIDVIVDCVGSSFTQKDICDAFDPKGARIYSAVATAPTNPTVPDGVQLFNITGGVLAEMPNGSAILKAVTALIEKRDYKVPLPVKTVGKGLENLSGVMDQVMKASGEKLVVAI